MFTPPLKNVRRNIVIGQRTLKKWLLAFLAAHKVVIHRGDKVGYVLPENFEHFLAVAYWHIRPFLKNYPAAIRVDRNNPHAKQFIQHGPGRHIPAVLYDQPTETQSAIKRKAGWFTFRALINQVVNPPRYHP